MVRRVSGWAKIVALLGICFIASCGGTECRCAEIHGKHTTSGTEGIAPSSAPEQAEPLEPPDSNPYATQKKATSSDNAHAIASEPKPTKADWKEMVRRGQRRFDKACGNCHPDGEEDLGPSLIGIRWTVPRMTKQIRKGSGKMKPISPKRLPESEMEPLMAYMSTFRAVKGVNQP